MPALGTTTITDVSDVLVHLKSTLEGSAVQTFEGYQPLSFAPNSQKLALMKGSALYVTTLQQDGKVYGIQCCFVTAIVPYTWYP